MVFHTRHGFSLPEGDEGCPRASYSADGHDSAPQPRRVTFNHAALQQQLTLQSFQLRGTAPASRSGPFASISSAALQVGQPGSTSRLHREAATGLEFPAEYCYLSDTNCPTLAGLGVRTKKILGLKNINVYALGIYVDSAGALKALSPRYKGASPASLVDNQQLYDDVVASEGFEKSLKVKISFGALRRHQFVEALQERLEPLLHKAGDPGKMQPFKALFDGVEFQKGLDITFVDAGKGQLVTHIAGHKRGVIESPALVRALFEVYLGPDPASQDAKVSFGTNLATLLNGTQ